jgi:outer membrane protein TolC
MNRIGKLMNSIIMICRTSLLAAVLWILLCVTAFASDQQTGSEKKTFTLDDVLTLALAANKDIKQAEKGVSIAQAQLNEGYANLYIPQVSLSGSAGYSYNGPKSNSQYVYNSTPSNFAAGVSASKTIFAGFSYMNKVEMQKKTLDLALFQLTDKITQVKSSVTTAFYNVIVLSQGLSVALLSDSNLKAHLDYANENFKLGGTTNIDVLQASVNYKTNVPKLMKARDDLEVARLNLCNMLGIAYSDSLVFDGETDALSRVSWNESDEAKITDMVLTHDTTLKSDDVTYQNAILTKETTEYSRLPQVSGNFSYRYNFTSDPSTGVMGSQPTLSLALQLTLPVDDLLPFSLTANQITEQSETEKQLELVKLSRIDALRLSTKTQLGQLNEQKATLEATLESMNLTGAQLAQIEAQSKKGISNPLDLDDARLASSQAIYAWQQALYNYASMVWNLEYITGTFGGNGK